MQREKLNNASTLWHEIKGKNEISGGLKWSYIREGVQSQIKPD